ncbi:putative dienelactone hydrolase [Variovorax sp. SRS16]|uniref:alpha/beta hydrolase family protein n=1 Tax=Variovorax sp. SRS16 TaxID=282217 RepID=UPI0013185EAB|nr:dienelactone hydrolase [Variovorax sp. SRS16]VTU23955.1 putative dienelactone hydrolase [Variovorax sp. SRS16]
MKAFGLRKLTLAAACLLAAAAQAATRLTMLRPPADSGPITVFYPTDATATRVQRGPFTLTVAVDAAPVAGNHRLIVMSHGSGGSGWENSDLAQALVAAGFTVAMPEHAGDNWHDHSAVGPPSWKHRPREVSQAIDAMAADARFAPLLDGQHVGMYGMSAGGLTALVLAGGSWSPALLARHCEAHLAEDFPTCVGLSSELDGSALDPVRIAVARRIIHYKFDEDTTLQEGHDARIAAVVAAVPMAAAFDMHSLAHPRVPLGLVRAGRDAWLAPQWHIDAVRAACNGCVLLADMKDAGHGSILSPPVPDLPPRAARLLDDPPGFDRRTLDGVYAAIVRFFVQNLQP